MEEQRFPRLHVLGVPLIEADIKLITDDGVDLATPLRDCTASVAIDRHSQPLGISFWPHLEQGSDGLFTADKDGQWQRPEASITLSGPIASFGSFVRSWGNKEDHVTFASETDQLISISLLGTEYVEPELSFYLAGKQVDLGYRFGDEGLEITLAAPLLASDRVHKDEIDLGAKLNARFLIPDLALPFAGFTSRSSSSDQVIVDDWHPSQSSIGDLATSGYTLAARGTLDWSDRGKYPGPKGPWVRCDLNEHSMLLKPIAKVSRLASGYAAFSRTEGEMELMLGAKHLERMLYGNKTHARISWSGPGFGHVDGVTTWPMEQGGPRPQEFERLDIGLTKTSDGVRMAGRGTIGPGGDLGPDVTFDFLIPSLWLRLRNIRFG